MNKDITRYYNNNSEKIFDNNNENIKTIKKLPQVKISDSSILLHLHHCSEVIIRQYPNVKIRNVQ